MRRPTLRCQRPTSAIMFFYMALGMYPAPIAFRAHDLVDEFLGAGHRRAGAVLAGRCSSMRVLRARRIDRRRSERRRRVESVEFSSDRFVTQGG
jgi:hypothetical protein